MRLDDLYATNFNEEYGWKVITQKAIVTDAQLREQSYCEVLAPLEGLQQMREEDEEAFEFQYQNQIPKNLDLRFKAEWLQYAQTFEDVSLYDAIGVGIDLSASLRETADYTVFTLIGKTGADYHVLDMRRGRWAGNLDKCWVLLGMLLETETFELCICNFMNNGLVRYLCGMSNHPFMGGIDFFHRNYRHEITDSLDSFCHKNSFLSAVFLMFKRANIFLLGFGYHVVDYLEW